MALYLYRLGRMAFRHRGLALGLWVLILVGASIAARDALGPHLHQLLHPRHRGPGRPSTRSRRGSRQRTPRAPRRGSSSRRPRAAR